MKRRVFNIGVAVSLGVFVGAVGLLVLSYVRPVVRSEGKWMEPGTRTGVTPIGVRTEWGVGGGYASYVVGETPARPAGVLGQYPIGVQREGWRRAGVRWQRERLTLEDPKDRKKVVAVLHSARVYAVSLGWPVLLSAVLPAWWAAGWWKARREKRKGCCRVCGYDLRASRGRCPECGTVF